MPLSEINLPQGVSSESVLAQLPGYFLWKDLESKYIAGSLDTAKLFGFNSIDQLSNITDFDINCPAARFAHLFVKQDQILKAQGKSITVLDIHPYVNNQQKVLLINKAFFYNENSQALGISCHASEIKHYLFEKMALDLFRQDQKFSENNTAANYYLNATYDGLNLTSRQEECFFYILRGMSSKQTARVLKISSRTVEAHLDYVKQKLNARKKSDVIEKALLLGYHEVIPSSIVKKGILPFEA